MLRNAILTTALASLALAAPLMPRQTCYSGVYMIVARGSNEAAGEGKPMEVADMIQSRVGDSASVAVDYPAVIIGSGEAYPESVVDGINDTKQKIVDYVNACGSSSRIVLLGYSQGGNVMTDLLAGGVDKPDPLDESYRRYITGVAVWGDPSYTANQSFDVGTATKSGIFAREEGGASLALLNTYADVVRSYCSIHDFFCASGDSLDVHYAEVDTYAQAAADFIVSRT